MWTLQGIAFAGKGDRKQALAAFQQALKIAPNSVAALAGAAQIGYEADNPEAVQLLNRLLELRPGDPTAHAMLAVLEYRKGDCPAAVPHFDQAGRLLDSQLDALHAYATCLAKLKRLDDAAAVPRRAVALRPDDPRERHLLASVQIMGRNPKMPSLSLQPLLDAGSPTADTLQLVSTATAEDAGDTPQAVSTLRQAVLLDPRNVSLYLDFANICVCARIVSGRHRRDQRRNVAATGGPRSSTWHAVSCTCSSPNTTRRRPTSRGPTNWIRAGHLTPPRSGLAAVQANDLDHALASIQSKLERKPDDALLLYLQADVLW